eukprot:CAMPEP_0197245300 /NCGR_PEP_ID=MMETSP1429-20130617/10129_1 /TAXON_ID=49237 /ORGANISM="Chaetoceros  sp., Strain UNC1202" /LENGTH=133 /DNA_ID=CAMNT_0042705769 /DNA_START=8 /DNA_END=406 /DNA_ORIENTATION=-
MGTNANVNAPSDANVNGINSDQERDRDRDQDRRLIPNPLLSDRQMLTVLTGDTVGVGVGVGPPVSVNMVSSVENSYQHAHSEVSAMVQNHGFSGRSDSFLPGAVDLTKGVTDDLNISRLHVLQQANTINGDIN